ncbi:glycoside hydrolase family 2 protein [Occallatibacter savannae]|uniref:glycoside hydrolase family 2 protein n=1 Tax=Occallatibacter savannae TaxID=1002691 RepID=UPI000D69AD58|nr:glycoside hydrolase family 2 TIM barrel-domain containing protein [Occallatibacter savannae]
MKRRDFLKVVGTATASAMMPTVDVIGQERETAGRALLSINRNWRYSPAKVEGAESPQFDDGKFDRVVIPHTNIELPWHNFDDREYEFVSTYRRRFKFPKEAEGKRVFVDFEGAMTASTVWINGERLGEYRGGFTPFSFELTKHLRKDGDNVLVVQVDSTERADIPPFGYEIDYLTFGGIYREVSLRIVPHTYIDNIFAQPKNVLDAPSLDVHCFLAGEGAGSGKLSLQAELLDGETVIGKGIGTIERTPKAGADADAALDPYNDAPAYSSTETVNDPSRHTISITGLKGIQLWDLDKPKLYRISVKLFSGGKVIDEDSRQIGFREATFTDHGFSLNGKVIKLRGLDRHQTFPFAGQAMPARAQRRDADILRKELHCNIVRTSHYPQSRHFLDRCDQIGLLVLEEIPGWQHIGDENWQKLAIDNVGRMIRRDWNHPSIVLWGVRINESRDNHNFYQRTNAFAHALDQTRQTGGIRYFQESEFLEDVFTMNDFGFPLKAPNHPRYLNTEFVGHTFPTKTTDDDERQREHTLRHARIHNQLASNPQYAGGIGWCAFDYNTHSNFGAGDRICYHGVTDIFREPKPAAGFYKSQCDPAEEVVLEPAFHWARSDESVGFTKAVFCSNCEHLKIYGRPDTDEKADWVLLAELDPNRKDFEHLKYAPFELELFKLNGKKLPFGWGDLRIEGYINGKVAIEKKMSGRGDNRRLVVAADDDTLVADGADTTRVVVRVTDQYGAVRTYADDPIAFTLNGPAKLIGDNPLSLVGGVLAVWVRAGEQPGIVRLTAKHARLGEQTVSLRLTAAPEEKV